MVRFLLGWFVKITGYIPQKLFFRTKVHYNDKRAQSRRIKGRAIVISNHRSVWDFAMMMFLFPMRNLRCLVAEIMFQKNAPFTFFLKAMGCIRVERDTHDFTFIEKSVKLLDKNQVLEIYPEARIPKENEEKPTRFTPSAVYIALESGAPIIPVFTQGNYFNKPRNHVIIGKPIYARDLYNETLSKRENIEIINNILRNEIVELENELNEKIKQKKS